MKKFNVAPQRKSPFFLLNEFDREFSQLLKPFHEDSSYLPKADMGEKDGHFWASFDVPGVKQEDLKISVNENHIIVSGERKEESEEENYSEKYYGKFEREFSVPKSYDLSKLEASYENGVLDLAAPKREKGLLENQEVEIKNGRQGILEKIFK